MPLTAPLRIHKQPSYSGSSSGASDSEDSSHLPTHSRALTEVGSSERRRNSGNHQMYGKQDDIPSSSPFPSPFQASQNDSPRNFWQGKLQENQPHGDSGSPSRRKTSLENLKMQSRVSKNLFQGHSPNGTPQGSRPLPGSQSSSPSKGSINFGKSAEQRMFPSAKQLFAEHDVLTDKTPSPSSQRSPTKSALASRINNLRQFDGTYLDFGDSLISTPPKMTKQVSFNEVHEVQEFEAPTPEPSTAENSYYTDSEADLTDDEDLHDTTKTPVIGPEDWAHVTPETINQDTSMPDPFASSNSNIRPLPSLPGLGFEQSGMDQTSSARALPALPTPVDEPVKQTPPRRLPLEERLRLMMQEDSPRATAEPPRSEHDAFINTIAAAVAKETRVELSPTDDLGVIDLNKLSLEDVVEEEESSDDEGFSPVMFRKEDEEDIEEDIDELPAPTHLARENSFSSGTQEKLDTLSKSVAVQSDSTDYHLPRISRESIKRQVQARRTQDEQDMGDVTTPQLERKESKTLPSVSLNSLAQMYVDENVEPELVRTASIARRTQEDEEDLSSEGSFNSDDESKYSNPNDEILTQQVVVEDSDEDEEPRTPTQASMFDNTSFPLPPSRDVNADSSMVDMMEKETKGDEYKGNNLDLPEFAPGDDGLGLREYMSKSPPAQKLKLDATTPNLPPPTMSMARDYLNRPSTPEHQNIPDDISEFDDEASVIRHSVYDSDEYEEEDFSDEEEEPRRSPSPVPERTATIRSTSGMKLKTRKSATPADIEAMAAARRQVSGDETIPPVPQLPSHLAQQDEAKEASGSDTEVEDEVQEVKHKAQPIALPELGMPALDVKMDSLVHEFDRVIEGQKRGYLMRQNTKVIHATSTGEVSDEKSTRAAKTQSWSVEPWKSNAPRRKSLKSEQAKKKSDTARQQHTSAMSTSKDLPILEENETPSTRSSVDEMPVVEGENNERGRLFVKVIGVKDLALPLPQGEPSYFCMTLDNGLHCVTTSWLELGKNAPIGQEFELVVLDDLEFQLTLQTKLLQPPPVVQTQVAPTMTTPQASPTKSKHKSAFSNIFTSPKKRKEMEKQQLQLQEQQQRQQAQAAAQSRQRQAPGPPSAWDLLHNVVATDGSFARSYISLKDFEKSCYGRPKIVDISCFNEWATDISSVKSKRSMPIKKAPYKIGKLEVQLLFVPKSAGMTDADLPKSMNSAIREIKEAESAAVQTYEGHLSQQGGDCPYWRRRWFKLEGSRLTAYHESTRQPRANINLSKASRLIDDRNSLTSSSGSQKRRKSGFSEDEEGYMFVEEGFRIRFANGECIDFYADSPECKKGWMKVLNETIGRSTEGRGWCNMVLKKEKQDRDALAKTGSPEVKSEISQKPTHAPPMPPSQMQQPQTSKPVNGHHQSQSVSNMNGFNSPAAHRNAMTPRGSARPQSYHAGIAR